MEKKLKVNFILKGIAVFAFVAFCLLAILAGVTLPFVSNASTTDSAVSSAENVCATASAESDNLYIPLSQVVNNTVYYGISVPNDSTNINVGISSTVTLFELSANDSGVGFRCNALNNFGKNQVKMFINKDNSFYDYQFLFYANVYSLDFTYANGFTFNDVNSINALAFNMNILVRAVPFSSDVEVENLQNQIATLTAEKNSLQIQVDTLTAEKTSLQTQLTEKQNQIDTLTAEKTSLQTQLTEKQNQIDTLTAEKNSLQAQLTEKQNQIDTLTSEKATLQAQLTEKQNQIDTLTSEKNALQNQLSNMNFMSHFGNFDTLAGSDFYVNLSSDIVLPDIFYQYSNNSTPINGWFLIGRGANMEIYGLNLFDRFYYNGTHEYGFLNCGFQLNIKSIPSTTIPPTYTNECTLDFVVYDTLVWSAVCDIDYNTDTKVNTITNIRNGSFKVTANYDKDTNVYQFTVPDNKLFLLNENYNKAYDTFRSYVVQQDYKKTKIPSDNALYLNGYQAASKDFYNNGYNDGVAAGEKSGYNKGFSAGDAQGYNRGVEVGGNYSFLGLFGAIFDAPIQAIFGGTTTLPAGTTIIDKNGNTTTLLSSATVKRAGLLNFDIMGVNLSGFVLALFSLSILVVVIKFALGRGR